MQLPRYTANSVKIKHGVSEQIFHIKQRLLPFDLDGCCWGRFNNFLIWGSNFVSKASISVMFLFLDNRKATVLSQRPPKCNKEYAVKISALGCQKVGSCWKSQNYR